MQPKAEKVARCESGHVPYGAMATTAGNELKVCGGPALEDCESLGIETSLEPKGNHATPMPKEQVSCRTELQRDASARGRVYDLYLMAL
jgi:hypothetical protein